jgi:hypothetical protein
MKTAKKIVTVIGLAVIVAGTFSLGLASADNGLVPGEPTGSCEGGDIDNYFDNPVESLTAPTAYHSETGTVRLYGAGCPRVFTDFTGQRWCLVEIAPGEGEINICSYNQS